MTHPRDTQPDLFVPPTRNTDPETSFAAARSVRHIRASQQAILGLLREHGPMMDEEIYACVVAKYGAKFMSTSGARTRRRELVDKGYVEDSSVRKRLRSGRLSIVWRVKLEP